MKTKTLSEICQLVKKEYEEGRYCLYPTPHKGMCAVVQRLRERNILTWKERERFLMEYYKSIKNRRVFYTTIGNKSKNPLLYAWPPKNRPARHKWLDQRI